MKKLLCFAMMTAFFGAQAQAKSVPKTVEQHLKNKIPVSNFDFSDLTWKQATDNYKYCKEDTKKWEIEVKSKVESIAKFSCEIQDDVAKGIRGYGSWQLPANYLLEVTYQKWDKGDPKVSGATILKVYDPSLKDQMTLKRDYLFHNFVKGESPTKIVIL